MFLICHKTLEYRTIYGTHIKNIFFVHMIHIRITFAYMTSKTEMEQLNDQNRLATLFKIAGKRIHMQDAMQCSEHCNTQIQFKSAAETKGYL
jgi:hypothetical protein